MDLDALHSLKGLSGLNWAAAAAHFVGLIVLAVLYHTWNGSKHASIDLYRYKIEGPTGPTDFQCEMVPPGLPSPTYNFNVLYACMAFFAITAGAHVFYATDAFGTMAYSRNLLEGWNPYRWIEYAISASIMIAAIGAVDGTVDTPSILLLFVSMMALMFNGYASESALRGRGLLQPWAIDSAKGSMVSGWLLFVGIWSVVVYNFAFLVKDINEEYKGTTNPRTGNAIHVPSWLWYILIMQFVYFASFGVVQFIQMRNRQMPHYEYAQYERAYISLSFFSKISLAGGLGYGLLWANRPCQ